MASNAAVPFLEGRENDVRNVHILCANLVRNCLKEPHKSESISHEKVHFSVSKWIEGKPLKPTVRTDDPEE